MTLQQLQNSGYSTLIQSLVIIGSLVSGTYYLGSKIASTETNVAHLQTEFTKFKDKGGRCTKERCDAIDKELEELHEQVDELPGTRFEKEFDDFKQLMLAELRATRIDIKENRKFIEQLLLENLARERHNNDR